MDHVFQHYQKYLTMKIKVLQSTDMSVTMYQSIGNNGHQGLGLQQLQYVNLESCIVRTTQITSDYDTICFVTVIADILYASVTRP